MMTKRSSILRADQKFLGGARKLLGGAELPQAPPVATPLIYSTASFNFDESYLN